MISKKLKPTWNSDRRELWVGDKLIKKYRQRAKKQEGVLAAFEELGWPERIDDPLPPKGDVVPKRRLRSTVDSLNRCHKTVKLIAFDTDGTGEGVLCSVCADRSSNRQYREDHSIARLSWFWSAGCIPSLPQ